MSVRSDVKAVAEQGRLKSEQLAAVREDLEQVREDVGVIKTDIQFIKHELKAKVDRDEFAALENRVSSLEAKVRQ